jgi:glycosyltransferase involved in cell wall biosynthesis
MPERTRVLWLVKSLAHGGAAHLLCLTARTLDRKRFDVEVAYVVEGLDQMVPALKAADVPVHCLGGRGATGGGTWIPRLRRLFHHGDFDLCHTHSPLPAAVARIVAPRRLPFIHTEHSLWPRYRWPTRFVNAATYGRNTAVLAVSQAVADTIRPPEWGPYGGMPPVHVLRHGIDEQAVRQGPAARADARGLLGLGPADLVIGSVARLAPEKDPDTLLKAFARVAAELPQARLVLVGTGPLEQRLRRRATTMSLDGKVQFTGPRDDVQRLLPACDVVALTSRHEGLGLALVEALAAGVPVVATDVGGVGEVVHHGRTGLLVPPGDVPAIAKALNRVLADPQLRAAMSAEAGRRAAAFSSVSATEATQALYERVLGLPQAVAA